MFNMPDFTFTRNKRSRRNRRPFVDWENLPGDLLNLILEKLVHLSLSGYIRFGAVCKLWHSVAINHKRRHTASHVRLPPMLLITQEKYEKNDKSERQRLEEFEPQLPKLYSISEGKVYNNLEIKVPPGGVACIGASYSWLIIQNQDFSITFFNPFTRNNIKMRGLPHQSCIINKAILSDDPSTCDDFVLATMYKQEHPNGSFVAFTQAGEECWTFLYLNYDGVRDIIFHKGLLYALEVGTGLLAIDWRCTNPAKIAVKIVTDEKFSHPYGTFYLAEATNGDLLMVHRIRSGTSATTMVYKLAKTTSPPFDKEVMDWVKIEALQNKDTMFLADSHSLCISAASCFSKFKPNSIYLIHNFKVKDKSGWWWLPSTYTVFVFRSNCDGEVGTTYRILNLKRQVGVQGCDDHVLPIACLSPTMAEFFKLCS